MAHLHKNILPLLESSNTERIRFIQQGGWIGYSRAKEILAKLENYLAYPKILRMPNLLLAGETNNGKTVLVNRFFSAHKAYIRQEDNALIAPVIYIQVPPKPDEKRLYNNILDALELPYRYSDKVERKQQHVIHILKKVETKMLVLDEIHHVLSGNMRSQRSFLNVIKYLANELQIVITAVGIPDAFNVINADPQMANRFETATLPKWRMNDEYLKLLASFENVLPLKKPSNLTNKELASKVLSMSEGTIGEINAILKKAACLAIENSQEKISEELLKKIDYAAPSIRKHYLAKFE